MKIILINQPKYILSKKILIGACCFVKKDIAGTAKAGKKRKPVPSEIKALWGEYKDPFINLSDEHNDFGDIKDKSIIDKYIQNRTSI